jgi:hypothetical protein
MSESQLLNRGTATTWSGVVQVERPDGFPTPDAMCKVYSARTLEFNGARAISVMMPYKAVRHYFQSDDEDVIQVAADLRGEHLQLHDRCDFKEWAHFSGRNN